MHLIFDYVEKNQVFFLILFGMIIGIILIFLLYLKEHKKGIEIENSVKKERDFYQTFSHETHNIFIALKRDDLTVSYISPNLYHLTGLQPELVLADIETLFALTSPHTARQLKQQIKEWTKEEELIKEIFYHPIGKDSRNRGRLVLSFSEETDHILLTFSDISEEFKIREELKQELVNAKNESNAKTDFLSRMSHEIRTPMNGILGMLNLAQTYSDDKEAVEQYLAKTENLSKFLLTLINDILDMSRIESGKMQLEEVPFDLSSMALKIDTMFSGSAKEKGILWELKMQNFNVSYVIGDEMRLSQVVINFISNAIKFTPKDGKVTVTFREMGQIDEKLHLMIRVQDSGKGMKADFLDKIFLPFEQEDASTAHNYGGSGLGMAIADNIIKLMNGEILVESEEGKGSEFIVYVSLPIATEDEIVQYDQHKMLSGNKQENTEQSLSAAVHDDFTLEGLHILLAEDNDINAEIAIEILNLDGAIVERAHDGQEAYHMFKNSNIGYYDVILMDIQMPNINGWEATKMIRNTQRSDQNIPIFAMSANAFIEDQRHSLQVGMNAHINKPIDFEQLRNMISEELIYK